MMGRHTLRHRGGAAAPAPRAFRQAIVDVAGADPSEWTPRELRLSFVAILSDQQQPIEEISRLLSHSSANVAETVYRHQIRPVLTHAARTMDGVCDSG